MDSFADLLLTAIKSTSITEWIIFIFALAYVILAAFEKAWCWIFGILSSALSVYLCFKGKLFLESGLSVFYVLIGFYGWYQWLYGSVKHTENQIISWPIKKTLVILLIGILLWIPTGLIASKYSTQALPYLDAFITVFSLLATWMTTKKILENWLFWIVIDALSISLYASRGFYLIALLYIIYTLVAAAGYFKWRKNFSH
ncbi:MAG: nicotinamide riboside transporter PnuC [Bacteroidota bacterium]|nr:nicotinamide riboside transporter PnuC [Bacteroidota bacterium]